MRIQKVNENKLEILLTKQDLLEANLSKQDFMSCEIQKLPLFHEILKIAHANLGFNFNNCKIMVESFSIPSIKSFFINITTLPLKKHIHKSARYKFNCYFIAKFNSFQNICAFCYALDLDVLSSLYFINNTYYLNIKITHIHEYRKILLKLKEFADSFKTQNFINENTELIIKDNAIDLCKKLI